MLVCVCCCFVCFLFLFFYFINWYIVSYQNLFMMLWNLTHGGWFKTDYASSYDNLIINEIWISYEWMKEMF